MIRILHAGFHKSGSTFLQKNFFPYLDGVNYIGSFNLNKGVILTEDAEILLFSNEASCGYPYPNTQHFSLDRLSTNSRLLSIDKIIIVKREFYSWVYSLYFQSLNEGRSLSLKSFINNNRTALLSWLDAPEKISNWCQLAGIDLLIVDYEELATNADNALQKIANFVGAHAHRFNKASENVSRKMPVTIFTFRVLNMLFRLRFFHALFILLDTNPRDLISGYLGDILERNSGRHDPTEQVKALFR